MATPHIAAERGAFAKIGPDTAMAKMPWFEHLCLGGFCFGAVFMATDPVTSSLTYFLEQNPQVAKAIVGKAVVAQRARMAARKARDIQSF